MILHFREGCIVFNGARPPLSASAHCSWIADHSLSGQYVTERCTPPPPSETLPSHI
ncbi:unnamed protein product [Staurois parvus]|uniref:Uncharacterized protein n=1 Tax=Staurois parvus TaxID=386267 RepID=A0ABN9ATA8_9NEOB|nr:unnamed protein product [Staurois parvus]